MTLNEWAVKWGVPYSALYDLQAAFGMHGMHGTTAATGAPALASESGVQSMVRLSAAKRGIRAWRNNTGVLRDDTGRPVRYGLCNDSPQMNKVLKSSDLVGIEPVTVTPEMIGHTIGRFFAREVKAPGWRYSGTDREVAQLRFIELVASMGGNAAFISDPTQL